MNETTELKKRVDEAVRVGRNYFDTGDTKYLPDFHKAQDEVRELNEKVYHVIDDCPLIYMTKYIKRYGMEMITDKKIYHIIDYLCGTNLEGCEDEH